MNVRLKCSNPKCKYHKEPEKAMFRKRGFIRKHGERTQRYQCKECGTSFIHNSNSQLSSFHNPEIIHEVFTRYTAGYSIRRMARDLKCSKNTVLKAIRFLGEQIRSYHYGLMDNGFLDTYCVAFDEMESFEKSKALPLAIGLAVNGVDGKILDIGLAEIRMKGALKKKLRDVNLSEEYTNRPNNSPQMRLTIFRNLKKCLLSSERRQGYIISDAKRTYLNQIRNTLPSVIHIAVVNRGRPQRVPDNGLPEVHNPYPSALNHLNSVCSAIRTYVSRMGRRTLITTKDSEMLRNHLWIFLAYRNGYSLTEILKANEYHGTDFYDRTVYKIEYWRKKKEPRDAA